MGDFGKKIVSSLGGALSGVAGGFVGSIGSKMIDGLFGSDPNKQNKEIMQMQNQFNAQEAQKNRDFQLQMFNRTNDYNSPKQQMQRFMEAGLNPDLMYGNGSSSIAAQSPSGSQASGTSPIAAVDMQQRAANVALTQAQTRLIEHQADNLDADTGKKGAETSGILTENEVQRQLAEGRITMQGIEISLAQFDLNELKPLEKQQLFHSVQNLQREGLNLDATLKEIKAKTANLDADTYLKRVTAYLNSAEVKARIAEIASRTSLNYAQIRYLASSLLLQSRGLDIQQQNADSQSKIADAQSRFVTVQADRLQFDFEIDQGEHKDSFRHHERQIQQAGSLTREIKTILWPFSELFD